MFPYIMARGNAAEGREIKGRCRIVAAPSIVLGCPPQGLYSRWAHTGFTCVVACAAVAVAAIVPVLSTGAYRPYRGAIAVYAQ